MNRQNPFPGMNPWLERSWPDVHTRLVGYISDALAPQLPPDLRVRAEEKIAVSSEGDTALYRADVAVSDPWRQGLPSAWSPEAGSSPGVTVAEPELVSLEPEVERWVEIRDRTGQLVTVVELLSPANKNEGAAAYRRKQEDIVHSQVNLVEIDLLRTGRPVLRVEPGHRRPPGMWSYRVCVSRAALAGLAEVYNLPLPERLPAFRVPLRVTDRDIALDLQPLIDRVYELGAYWQTDYTQTPGEPWSPEEAAWVAELLRPDGSPPR